MKKLAMVLSVASACLAAPLAQAVPILFHANLTGGAENPANASSGTGSAVVVLDTDANTLRINVVFSGLGANTSAAHIHCCTTPNLNAPAVIDAPTIPGFPLGVTSGTYEAILDLNNPLTYSPSFVTANGNTAAGAEAALAAAMLDGLTYFNIHTTQFPGGEIRGQFRVPEPASMALLGLGLLGLGFSRKFKR